MSVSPPDHASTLSSSGFEDGLGRRVLEFDRETGGMLERLVLRPELSAFEKVLIDRIALVAALEDERFPRPRGAERRDDRLTVLAEYAAGRRLSDILECAADHGIVAGLDAALGLLLEILPALSRLHDAGLAHGALAPGRLMITPAGQIALLDAIYAEPLERLQLTRKRLWAEFRLAFPPTAGPARFDKSADLSHAAMVAVSLSVGRVLQDADYPEGLPGLRQEIHEIAAIRGSKSFADAVDKFFAATMPLAGRRPAPSADEAAIDLRKLVRKELGINTCRTALLEFLQQIETADAERTAAEAQERDQRIAFAVDAVRRESDRKQWLDEPAAKADGGRRGQAARAEAERAERERAEADRIAREHAEAERRERERREAERIEQERIARERAEAERRERERLDAERQEQARRERERAEAERLEQERLEAERLEQERIAYERAEAERRERERLEAERLEKERIEKARLEAERRERERLEAERRERERLEAERLEQERIERERLEAERRERERLEAERRERERLEAERLERERIEQARLEAERRERERLEAERRERERLEAERLERERIERERLEAERRERERLEAERRERERIEAERREKERIEQARLEAERIERERIEAERRERERLEAERREQERIARERAEAEKRERERLEAERREQERIAHERAEAEQRERERLEAERREQERIARERAEAEQRERERLEAEQRERERLEAERREQERAEQARRERERAEKERAEKERAEKERAEKERAERERAEKARLEAERRERERQDAERAAREAREQADRGEAAAVPTKSGWLVPPNRAAAFEPVPSEAQPKQPAAAAKPYPIYVAPPEPAAPWTPGTLPEAATQEEFLASLSQIRPPAPAPAPAAPARSPIRLKGDDRPAAPPPRVEVRREPVEERVSASDAYEPFRGPEEKRQIPWKLIAAGVVLVAGGLAVWRGYAPVAAPVVDTVRKVIPAPTKEPELPPVGANVGRLVITTQPAGAKVSLDGKPAGETPLTIDAVKPGRHVVAVAGADGSARRTVRVEAGQVMTLDFPLYSGFVALSIPFVVDVSEGGKVLGTSENQIILGPGRHTLRLVNKALEYSATETVEVVAGESTRLELDPMGRANINAAPWAEVWIDGEKAGETPLANVPIRLGTREIVFKNPQFPERKQTVTITAGTPATISVDFIK